MICDVELVGAGRGVRRKWGGRSDVPGRWGGWQVSICSGCVWVHAVAFAVIIVIMYRFTHLHSKICHHFVIMLIDNRSTWFPSSNLYSGQRSINCVEATHAHGPQCHGHEMVRKNDWASCSYWNMFQHNELKRLHLNHKVAKEELDWPVDYSSCVHLCFGVFQSLSRVKVLWACKQSVICTHPWWLCSVLCSLDDSVTGHHPSLQFSQAAASWPRLRRASSSITAAPCSCPLHQWLNQPPSHRRVSTPSESLMFCSGILQVNYC